MTVSKERRDFPSKPPVLESYHFVNLLGGEPLEGSGFETQSPEPGFQFDWSPLTDRFKGGVR